MNQLVLSLITILLIGWNSFTVSFQSKRYPVLTRRIPISYTSNPQFTHSKQKNTQFQSRESLLTSKAISFPSSESLARVVKGNPGSLIKRTASKMDLFRKSISVIILATLNRFNRKVNSTVRNGAETMETGWARRGYGGSFRRTLEVWSFIFSYAIQYALVQRQAKKDPVLYKENLRKIAKVLTNKILILGPTFIKLGQLLSTRIDLFPKEFVEELSLLQDKVPGFSGEIAVQLIEKEFQCPIDQIFQAFNQTPIAAASLGQVHLARLQGSGEEVAVKIQRQGLKELFDMDLKNIKVLAKIFDQFDPKSDGAQRDWLSIYDESAKLLYQEIDYQAEARNAQRFQANFAKVPWIKVPNVYFNLTSPRVITMEYVPGIKINDIAAIERAGIDRKLLAKRSAESYLTQLCRHGFFHCDPHPGNVACDSVEGGRLIYYDFGMMDELSSEVKTGLVNLIFGVFENDAKEVCNALEVMGVLKRGVDRLSVEKIARFFLNEFANGIKPGEKWVSQLPPEKQKEIRRQRRLKLGADLFSVGNDVPFQFPPTFTFVFRAFTSLDGIGKGLDAAYDLTRLAQPYLKELVDLRDGSATLSFFKTLAKQLGLRPVDLWNTISQPRKVAHVDEVLTKMEQGELKLRVRVLESERSFQKMALTQQTMNQLLLSSSLLNIGFFLTLLTSLAPLSSSLVWLSGLMKTRGFSLLQRGVFLVAALVGAQVPLGVLKLKLLEKKFAGFEK